MTFIESMMTGDISTGWLVVIIVLMIWALIWKLIAMWKSARNSQLGWFIVLGIVNTIGILDILYIYVFSKKKSIGRTRSKSRRR